MISRAEGWLGRWLVALAVALGGCGACEEDPVESRVAERPPRAEPAVSLAEVEWPPAFRGVPAPEGTWGDHQLAVHPETGEPWLASFDSGDDGSVLLSRFDGSAWEARSLDLPAPMGGSFLRFAFDGRGDPHLLYFRVVGEIDTESYEAQIVHAFRRSEQWQSEVIHSEPRELDRASSVGWLVVDAAGEVAFAHRQGRAAPTLVRRGSGGFEERTFSGRDDVGLVLAFEMAEPRVRFAWTDPTRSKIFVSAEGGPTRELHEFDGFSMQRHVSALFTPNGELHVAAEHHDGVSFLHLVFDDDGIRRSSVAPFADGIVVRPTVGIDGAGALVAHARVLPDGSAGELWLTRVQRHLRPVGVEVGALETREENFVFVHGPPVVTPDGGVFIGTKGWIEGPGTIWVGAQ